MWLCGSNEQAQFENGEKSAEKALTPVQVMEGVKTVTRNKNCIMIVKTDGNYILTPMQIGEDVEYAALGNH